MVCCKQTCLHISICLGNRDCFDFCSALTLFLLHFYILFKVSRLYTDIASYKIKLSKLTKLKILIPRGSYKHTNLLFYHRLDIKESYTHNPERCQSQYTTPQSPENDVIFVLNTQSSET